MNIIGIDFGGTNIKIGIFINGQLLKTIMFKNEKIYNISEILDYVVEKIEMELEKQNLIFSMFRGIGIAIPGIVNFKEKKVLSINDKYNTAINFDFVKWFMDKLNLPIIIENDANAGLLGEIALGTTDNANYAGLYILGTGVGTALYAEGKLYRGAHFQGGCLGGHFIINYKGNKCTCGSTGCVEAEASTWALKKIKGDNFGFKELIESVESGNDEDSKLLDKYIDCWASGIASFVHAYDPEVIVLSGGISKGHKKILQPLIKKVNKLVWSTFGEVKFVLSKNPELSVIYGLNYLVNKEMINNEVI